MYLSRAAIALLSTVLSCWQFTHWVKAFSRSSLPRSHGSPTKLSGALESAEEQAYGENDSFEQLMDEAVLLYSVVSQRTKFDDNTEAQHDILNLRENELTSLIEDAVFDARGILHDGLPIEESISTNIVKEKTEPETVDEISQALDDQIILGYEATFTEEELVEWIGGINTLREKLESQLAALPPASDASTETAPAAAAAPPTPFDRMHVRLESMRTLIDPVGRNRLRLPLARPIVVPKQNVQSNSVAKPVPPPFPPSPEPNTEVKGTNENDNSKIEIKSKESLPKVDAPTKIEIESTFIEAMNKAAELTSTEATKIDTEDVAIESAKESVESVPAPPPLEPKPEAKATAENENLDIEIQKETTLSEVNTPSKIEIENAFIEAINKAAESTSTTATKNDTEESVSESIIKAVSAPHSLEPKTEAKASVEKENPIIETLPEEDTPTKIEIENAFFEALNKAAEPTNDQDDSENDRDLETNESLKKDSQNDKLILAEDDALITTKAEEEINVKVQENNDGEIINTENMLVDSTAEVSDGDKVESKQIAETSEPVDSSAMEEKEKNTKPSNSITPNPDGNKSEEAEISHTEESKTATTSKSRTATNNGAVEPLADATTDLVVPHYEASVEPQENVDVVSTVVTAAAFAAAVIMLKPLMVAGVALGPVIGQSIAYAKSQMKKPSGMKATEKKATPKTKPRSAFDKKKDGEDSDVNKNVDESNPN
jgi:hypothetical protein